LVPLFSEDGRFYVLALSQKHVRFFAATRLGIQEIAVPEMLRSIGDLRQYDQAEEHIQGHTMALTQASRTNVVLHGQGTIADKATYKDDVTRYIQAVARKLEKYLGTDTAPLVLAAVEYEQALYRQENAYHNLLDEGILGNPEELDQNQIHDAAWEIVEPYFAQARQTMLDHYANLSNTDKASDRLEAILPAAYHGRVRTLFIEMNSKTWGQFDPETLLTTVHDSPGEGDIDLIDLATVYVLEHQGTIYALGEETRRSPHAAIPVLGSRAYALVRSTIWRTSVILSEARIQARTEILRWDPSLRYAPFRMTHDGRGELATGQLTGIGTMASSRLLGPRSCHGRRLFPEAGLAEHIFHVVSISR
jgi:hypothetical protein